MHRELPSAPLTLRQTPLSAFVLMGALAACHAPHDPKAPSNASAAVEPSGEVDSQAGLLRSATETAVRACLSNETTTEAVGLRQQLKKMLGGVAAAATVETRAEALRGASRELPSDLQAIEDDKIRDCMKSYMQPVLAATVAVYQAVSGTTAWPEPVDLRFHFLRTVSADSKRFSRDVHIYLRPVRHSPLDVTLAPQDPKGLNFYEYSVAYPADGDTMNGTIVAETAGDSVLSSDQPTTTEICLQRPAKFPSERAEYDFFDCPEGGVCRPSRESTGWLQACSPKAARADLHTMLWKADWTSLPATGAAVRWIAPSLKSLAGRPHEGVGYTVFTLSTDAFRKPGVIGVEVGVKVNGVPVEEEGLPPNLRPAPNDPKEGFTHSFALQALNFSGARGGCDAVDVSLTPLLANGVRGQARTARLAYVALRDVPARTQPLGAGQLRWLASYITPEREWRHMTFVHSYVYRVADGAAAAQSAAARAVADKAWLDKGGPDERPFTYAGLPIVGVVRPPRIIQDDGTAAFGLGVGLVQPNGQIRFTFSETETRKMMAFMRTLRTTPKARTVIAPEPFLYQAKGGVRTIPGVCESIA